MTTPQEPRYILCQYVAIPNSTKTDKIPLNYKTLQAHNPLDTSIHMPYEEAKNVANLLGAGYGIGFVFMPEDKYFFLDLDNCLQPDNKWSMLTFECINRYPGAYTEVSNSGRGIHIIGRFKGNTPPHGCRNAELGLELYTSGRFCAITETNAQGNANTIHTQALHSFIAEYFNKPIYESNSIHDEWTTESCDGCNPPEDDQEFINLLLKRPKTNREIGFGDSVVIGFKDLFEANQEILSRVCPPQRDGQIYDRSRADYLLAKRLMYFTGYNCEKTERIMNQSQLVINRYADQDNKWDREDYRRSRTILKAKKEYLSQSRNNREDNFFTWETTNGGHHNPKSHNTPSGSNIQQNHLIDINQMHDLFKDCIYVLNEHKVFMPNGNLLSEKQFRAFFGGYYFPMDESNEKRVRNAWDCFNESFIYKKIQVDGCRWNPLKEPRCIIQHENKTYVNTYIPIETKRVNSSVELFLDWTSKMYPDKRDHQILLSYMAAIVQYKGIKFTWSILMQGVPGNGKSLIATILNYCISDAYTHYPKASELTGRFNSWMYGKLLIIVEDLSINHQALDTLKPMITGNKYEIEKKGVDKVTQEVYCNFIFNTNHKDGLQKTKDDRRIAPLFTAQQYKEDLERDGMPESYFVALRDWLENKDGYAAINEFLSTYEIPDEFNPADNCIRAPKTSATEEAIEHGLDDSALRIKEWVAEGHIGFKNGWISSMAINRKIVHEHHSKISPRRLPLILESIGYIMHPGLNKGRTTKVIELDHGQPTLYIHHSHTTTLKSSPSQISDRYESDQE